MIGQIKKLLSSDNFEDQLIGAELLRKHTTLEELELVTGFRCGRFIKYITFEIPQDGSSIAFVIGNSCFKSHMLCIDKQDYVIYIGKHRTIEEAEE